MESANEKLEKKVVFSPYYGDKKLRPNGGAIHFYLLGHQQVSGKTSYYSVISLYYSKFLGCV